MTMYMIMVVLLLWQVFSFRGAWRRVKAGNIISVIMFPLRLLFMAGVFGFVTLTPQAEMVIGFSPIHAVFGSPHFWRDLAAKHGCEWNTSAFTMKCP